MVAKEFCKRLSKMSAFQTEAEYLKELEWMLSRENRISTTLNAMLVSAYLAGVAAGCGASDGVAAQATPGAEKE